MENKNDIKYRMHLYSIYKDTDNWKFPLFPENSYETTDKNKILNELNDLFNNHISGITKIVIETTEFGNISTLSRYQSIQNLD